MKTLDPIVWRGDDEKFNLMVAATERAPSFDMCHWGDGRDAEHECATAGCLWGNYAAAVGFLTLNPYHQFRHLGTAAEHLSISDCEWRWLFSEFQLKMPALLSNISDQWMTAGARKKPRGKDPNLSRLKKYLAWKRRKADRIALDEALQHRGS